MESQDKYLIESANIHMRRFDIDKFKETFPKLYKVFSCAFEKSNRLLMEKYALASSSRDNFRKSAHESDVKVKELLEKNRELKLYIINERNVLLEKYSEFLEEHGYMDTDWRAENPKAIDSFLTEYRRR